MTIMKVMRRSLSLSCFSEEQLPQQSFSNQRTTLHASAYLIRRSFPSLSSVDLLLLLHPKTSHCSNPSALRVSTNSAARIYLLQLLYCHLPSNSKTKFPYPILQFSVIAFNKKYINMPFLAFFPYMSNEKHCIFRPFVAYLSETTQIFGFAILNQFNMPLVACPTPFPTRPKPFHTVPCLVLAHVFTAFLPAPARPILPSGRWNPLFFARDNGIHLSFQDVYDPPLLYLAIVMTHYDKGIDCFPIHLLSR